MPIYKSYNGQEIYYELGNFLCDLLYRRAKSDKKNSFNIKVLKHPEDLHYKQQQYPRQDHYYPQHSQQQYKGGQQNKHTNEK